MVVRTVIGVLLVAALVGLLWLDVSMPEAFQGAAVAAILSLLMLLAFIEMLKLLATKGVEVLWISGGLGAVGLTTLPFWWQCLDGAGQTPESYGLLLLLGFLLMLIFLDQMVQQALDTALLRIAATALTVLYLGVGGALIVAIRLQHGLPMFVLFLAAVKFTDIGAYFTGSLFGRHRLVAKLSPKKSWEGLIGGLVLGALAGVVTLWSFGVDWPIWQTAGFSVALGVAGQFGDLCESLLKRSAHVKDSGSVLPAFGGVLDILDSLLLAAPVALALLTILA